MIIGTLYTVFFWRYGNLPFQSEVQKLTAAFGVLQYVHIVDRFKAAHAASGVLQYVYTVNRFEAASNFSVHLGEGREGEPEVALTRLGTPYGVGGLTSTGIAWMRNARNTVKINVTNSMTSNRLRPVRRPLGPRGHRGLEI